VLFCLVSIQIGLIDVQRVAAQTGSFVYGGQSSTTLLPTWLRTTSSYVSPQGRQVEATTWRDPNSGLAATWQVEHIDDSQSAVEYSWRFENKSTQATKAITNVAALDLTLSGASQKQLLSSTGGLPGPFYGLGSPGFIISQSNLAQSIALSSENGKSSNKDLPLWVIHDSAANSGQYMGVGWSGQWQATFQPVTGQNASRLMVGMQDTNISLQFGQNIVSPSILVGNYQGNQQAGSNALRRVINDKYVAKLGNSKLAPPVSWNSWTRFGNDINETMLKNQIDASAGLGLEYFCIDAGWFDGAFQAGVGNWTVDATKFPNGLAPIGQYAAQNGMKLGLWFETDRAMPGTRLATAHPEWVGVDNQLKLEIPAARDWIFNAMCENIDQSGAKWIRYDMNGPETLVAWNARDTADTQGLTQIQYLQGEYELLDRLRAKYPDMVIESCAGGGRRIDLETISRAQTFWRTDEPGNLIATRSQATGGNYFLPGGLLNTNLADAPAFGIVNDKTTFNMHSLFAGPLGFSCDWTPLDAETRANVSPVIAEYKQVRHLLNKDYYPLFPQTFDTALWNGWEFYDPATGEGFLTVLRPQESSLASCLIQLGGVESDALYELSRIDGSQLRQIAGSELLSGLMISLAPGRSEVLRFHVVPEPSVLIMSGGGVISLLTMGLFRRMAGHNFCQATPNANNTRRQPRAGRE
jgi:alpha-galactosidase